MSEVNKGSDIVPLWLDCDPGHDDACAILFAAHHPNLQLLGVSTVHGNAPLSKTTSNAIRVLGAIGKSAIPVFPGCLKPFCRTVEIASDIHGESGLDGTDLLPPETRQPLHHCNAIREIRDSLMAQPAGTAWLVATGTLTNIALVFTTFPEVAHHIKGLSIMGGAIGNGFSPALLGPSYTDADGKMQPRIGNRTPFAEFNIWCDPEAAQSIMKNPILRPKTILIPLDLTHQAFVNKDVQRLLLGTTSAGQQPTKLRRMFNELLMFFASRYAEVFGIVEGPPLHDPLAVAVILSQHIDDSVKIQLNDAGGERWDIDVRLSGEQVGRTVVLPSHDGIIIPRTIDLDKFWKDLEQCMARADEVTGYQQ